MGGIGSGKYSKKINKNDYPKIALLFIEKENMAEIAREKGVTREAIRRILAGMGVTGRSLLERKKGMAKILFKKWLSLPKRNAKMTLKDFQEFCHSRGLRVSFKSVRQIIKESGGMFALRASRKKQKEW